MNSINYYKKYIKYRNKYLVIKNQIGGIPFRDIIFDIPDIQDAEMNLYLNPLFGFVFYSNGFIFNYKYFYPETSVGKIIWHEKFFIQVGNVIKPSKYLLPKITCTEIGIIAGLLYLICIKKINVDSYKEIIKQYPIYKSSTKVGELKPSEGSIKRSKELSTRFYNAFYSASTESELSELSELSDLFRLLLVILWWKIDNKENIKEYYDGLNFVFSGKNNEDKVMIIPFNLIEQTPQTIEFKELFINSQSHIELTEMGLPNHFCSNVVYIDSGIMINEENYPNCGENVLNNLFNIIGYFYGEDFVNKLESLCADPKLINYYKTFTKENINKEINFYGKESYFMAAWSHVVSNLNKVNYNRRGIRDGEEYKFEIKSGFSQISNKLNILQVISELIPDVNSWEDFTTKFSDKSKFRLEITKNINRFGNGNIIININSLNFNIKLITGHYEISQDKKIVGKKIQFKNIKDEKIKNLIYINLNIDIDPNQNFKYIKWTNTTLIELIRNQSSLISDKIYDKIINFGIKTFTDDEIAQLPINLNKISDKSILIKLKKLNLSMYNEILSDSLFTLTNLEVLSLYSYNMPLNGSLTTLTNLENLYLISYNHPLNDSLSTLINLKNLFLENYNMPLNGSLTTLANLETLNLNSYIIPLNDSLSTLINLKNLVLENYNMPLNGSLTTLINLEILNLYNYNHQLNGSLSTLKKLKILHLDNYDEPLNGSLTTLANLETLYLNSYDMPLNSSLSTLINLKFLNLNSYDRQLNGSLSTLINLNYLELESYDDIPLNNSLSNLINLETLKLDNYNMPLNDSLTTLANLIYLTLYNEPDSDDESLPTNIKILKFKINRRGENSASLYAM